MTHAVVIRKKCFCVYIHRQKEINNKVTLKQNKYFLSKLYFIFRFTFVCVYDLPGRTLFYNISARLRHGSNGIEKLNLHIAVRVSTDVSSHCLWEQKY